MPSQMSNRLVWSESQRKDLGQAGFFFCLIPERSKRCQKKKESRSESRGNGHSQVDMVTEIYSHIINEDRQRNTELFAKVLVNLEMKALLTSLAKAMKG